MQWFRMYAEFAYDPKVQMLSETTQRRYLMLLCLQCNEELPKMDNRRLAFVLRISEKEMADTIQELKETGLLNNKGLPMAWEKRQMPSDASAIRVKRHREKRKARGLPEQNYISKALRKEIYERDNNRCVYCGSSDDLTIDHDISELRGGDNNINNLLTACRVCNASKRDLTHDEYCARNGIVTLLKRGSNALDKNRIDKNRIDKKVSKNRGSRFALVALPKDWRQFCLTDRPELDPIKVFGEFRDYWIALPGQRGVKLDWDATWRNWVRRQQKPKGEKNAGQQSKWLDEGARLAAEYRAQTQPGGEGEAS